MNIEIRRVEPGDYQAVCAVHAQPNVLAGTLQLPFPSEEAWKERLAKFGERDYGLVACVEGEIVGMLSLQVSTRLRRAHVGDLGMAVHDKWAGKGVGSALIKAAIDLADKWLNLSRLELTVYTDNEPALRLYKRLGFEIEGTHRKYAFRDGSYVDAYTMARTR
ncbi:MAG: GNAT family N-acetyltransferase [Betaproteobacteria bacterium]|nr:MAG: GNAT family N-acetyltransferase [Betaproteobacteria bacterium]